MNEPHYRDRTFAGAAAGHFTLCRLTYDPAGECDLECLDAVDLADLVDAEALTRTRRAFYLPAPLDPRDPDELEVDDETLRRTQQYALHRLNLSAAVGLGSAIRGVHRIVEAWKRAGILR